MEPRYELLVETPCVDEFCRLRVLAGMSPRSAEGAEIGLQNTFYAVVVRLDRKLVGMGRVVGDGGLVFQIVDMAVDPEHQGRGLGKAIMKCLTDHLAKVAPLGAHITLQADGPAKHLYAEFGFRETAPHAVAMELPIRHS
jgi:GNAT superfamily N-acetyltransferase